MQFIQTQITDVILIEPEVFEDDRGFFMETYQKEKFQTAGISYSFVQDNHSRSIKGTLRGLHYQIIHSQGKLVRVILGEVYDVAVDLRQSSPNFGKWVGCILSAQSKKQIWLPPGFAHGFYVLSDWAEVLYKATDFYNPESERSVLWNDPSINIEWPIIQGTQPILSKKDASAKTLDEAELYK
jgi:dTDP-4-dehydrorhamnose 3,5-epimerase